MEQLQINNGTIHSLPFADDQILIGQDHKDLEFMTC